VISWRCEVYRAAGRRSRASVAETLAEVCGQGKYLHEIAANNQHVR
jgi:hypothetical protein